MKVSIKRGDEVVYSSISTKEVIEKPTSPKVSGLIKVSIAGGSREAVSSNEDKKIANPSGIKASIGKTTGNSNSNTKAEDNSVKKNTNKTVVKNGTATKKTTTKVVEEKPTIKEEFIFEETADDAGNESDAAAPEVADSNDTAEGTNLDFEVIDDTASETNDEEVDDGADDSDNAPSYTAEDAADDYSMYDDDDMFAGTRTPIRRSNRRSSEGEGSRSSSYKKGSSTKVSKKK